MGYSNENKIVSITKILGLPKAYYGYRDENPLNCTRNNFIANYRARDKSTTEYYGVTKTKAGYYHVNFLGVSYGDYASPEFAASVYDCVAYRQFGENCILNFPDNINENIKLVGDKDYRPIPTLRSHNRISSYAGVIKAGPNFAARAGNDNVIGCYKTEQDAALAVSFMAKITGLVKTDPCWMNFPKDEYKKLIKDFPKEEKDRIRKAFNFKWA